ncbi:hypothetical protein 32HC_35 [Mycobacterium phage 32HC]|uniref:Uncharacterized protein n=1 Tax=Mycobacterium phage 32HC TaxID=1445729 RepID=W8EAE3_9CAUD|nr:hypothetical protein ST32HC_35 [Mycobacterium phage 32HC]AHJ86313.1 hypothetical protein 32HC_35 [Mycobacterium phage 32HC]
MFSAIVAHAIAILAAGALGSIVTYVCCCVRCDNAHHVEIEQPIRRP